jgi:translation initiation factor 4A
MSENDDVNYTINSWEDLSINPLLLRGIYAYGFESPSPIQKKSILPIFILILDSRSIASTHSGLSSVTF